MRTSARSQIPTTPACPSSRAKPQRPTETSAATAPDLDTTPPQSAETTRQAPIHTHSPPRQKSREFHGRATPPLPGFPPSSRAAEPSAPLISQYAAAWRRPAPQAEKVSKADK